MSNAAQQADKPSLYALETSTLQGRNRLMGFWFFLAGESVLFASLIGTYLALKGQTSGGVGPQDVFELPLIFIATVVLLTSSLTSVLAIVGMQRGNAKMMHGWLFVTILLGLTFLGFEAYEFVHYHSLGLTFSSSAFGSGFYALVGFHGAHVIFGVTWLSSLQIQALDRASFNLKNLVTWENSSKFYIASLYWHFVDVVWVLVFTIVYLMGKVG